MRVVACALVALALGTIASGPAAAQYPGPERDDRRSGPPRYFTDRPIPEDPRQGFDRPPYDGPRQGFDRVPNDGPRQGFDRPPNGGPRQNFERLPNDGPRQSFERPPSRGEPNDNEPRRDRAGNAGPRPWPAASDRGERRPDPSSRRIGGATPSDNYRRFWDDGDNPPARRTVNRPPAPRDAPPDRRVTKPRVTPQAPHTASPGPGPGKVTISVAEYRALQDQARELQRLLGRRSDFREGPRRDFRDRDERPDSRVFYR